MNIFRKMMDDFIKWNLEKYTRKTETGATQYYVPEIDEWVYMFSKNVVRRSGLTQRTWYNKYILGEDENFYPKCALSSCNNKVKKFKGTKYGYSKYCCLKHSGEDEDSKPERRESISKAMSDPKVKEKESRSLKIAFSNPEYRAKLSKRVSDSWKDEKYRERNLCKIPRSKNCVSKISIEFFDKVSEIFRMFGFSSIYYGKGNEYRVRVVNENEKMTYRYLDFFCRNLNLIIEFNGDYWHSEKKVTLPDGRNSDRIRMNQIYESMSKDIKGDIYLINIYEYEYRKNKDDILDKIKELLFCYLQFGSLEDYGNGRVINLRKLIGENNIYF